MNGLTGSGLVLSLAGTMNQTLSVTSNGNTSFPTSLAADSEYALTVAAQPASPAQYCTIANGSGEIGTNSITIAINCGNTYTVGGSISGLAGSGLVIQSGQNTLVIANGATSFTLPQPILSGTSYQVAIGSQPNGETCVLSNSSGSVETTNISNIQITCEPQCPTGFTAGATSVLLTNTVLPAGTPITTPEPGPTIRPGPGGLIAFINKTSVSGTVLGLYYFTLAITSDVKITVPATFTGYGGILYESLQGGAGGTAVPINFGSIPGNSITMSALPPGEYLLEISGDAGSGGSYSGTLVFPGEMPVLSCGMQLNVAATPDAVSTTAAQAGATVAFTAAVMLPDGSQAKNASGTVTILPAGSSTPVCSMGISQGGGNCSYTLIAASDQSYTAIYSGDSNYPGAQASAEVLVIAPFAITDLGANTVPIAIGNSSQVLEYQGTAYFLYSGGTTVQLPASQNGTPCNYAAMNSLGHVAGVCGTDVVLYSNGALQDLGNLCTGDAG